MDSEGGKGTKFFKMASSEFLFCFQCKTPVGAASIEGGSLLKVGSYCNFVTLHAVFVGG